MHAVKKMLRSREVPLGRAVSKSSCTNSVSDSIESYMLQVRRASRLFTTFAPVP